MKLVFLVLVDFSAQRGVKTNILHLNQTRLFFKRMRGMPYHTQKRNTRFYGSVWNENLGIFEMKWMTQIWIIWTMMTFKMLRMKSQTWWFLMDNWITITKMNLDDHHQRCKWYANLWWLTNGMPNYDGFYPIHKCYGSFFFALLFFSNDPAFGLRIFYK